MSNQNIKYINDKNIIRLYEDRGQAHDEANNMDSTDSGNGGIDQNAVCVHYATYNLILLAVNVAVGKFIKMQFFFF